VENTADFALTAGVSPTCCNPSGKGVLALVRHPTLWEVKICNQAMNSIALEGASEADREKSSTSAISLALPDATLELGKNYPCSDLNIVR
jgi:hypothetical protein